MVAVKQAQSEVIGPSNVHQVLDAKGSAASRMNNEKSGLACEAPRSLNDPLTIAFNYLFAAKNILKSTHNETKHQAVDYLDLASQALEEVSNNVCNRAPKNTSIGELEQDQSYALQDAIYEAASMAHLHLENSDIRTQIKCAPQLPQVSIKRTHVHQLIVNLMLYLAETSPPGTIEKFAIELTVIQYGHISVALSARSYQTHAKAAPPVLPSPCEIGSRGPANRLKHCQAILQKNGGEFITETTKNTNQSFLLTLPIFI